MANQTKAQTKAQRFEWFDRLIAADEAMQRASDEYEATLGDPRALIDSVEWQRFSAAAEARDALRNAYWKNLLILASLGRRVAP